MKKMKGLPPHLSPGVLPPEEKVGIQLFLAGPPVRVVPPCSAGPISSPQQWCGTPHNDSTLKNNNAMIYTQNQSSGHLLTSQPNAAISLIILLPPAVLPFHYATSMIKHETEETRIPSSEVQTSPTQPLSQVFLIFLFFFIIVIEHTITDFNLGQDTDSDSTQPRSRPRPRPHVSLIIIIITRCSPLS